MNPLRIDRSASHIHLACCSARAHRGNDGNLIALFDLPVGVLGILLPNINILQIHSNSAAAQNLLPNTGIPLFQQSEELTRSHWGGEVFTTLARERGRSREVQDREVTRGGFGGRHAELREGQDAGGAVECEEIGR